MLLGIQFLEIKFGINFGRNISLWNDIIIMATKNMNSV